MNRPGVFVSSLVLVGAAALSAQAAATPLERRIRDAIAASRADQIAYLQRVVDIPSSTLNLAGVRQVGETCFHTDDPGRPPSREKAKIMREVEVSPASAHR